MKVRSILAAATALASLILSSCASSPEQGVTLADLDIRFRSAYVRQANAEAARALAQIAARFPDALSRYPDVVIGRTAHLPGTGTAAEQAARFELLQKLFALNWKYECGIEPSSLWADLIRELVDHGRVDEAVQVVPHIQSPGQMILLRVDKRFDEVLRRAAPVLSVEGVATANLQNWRQANAKCPRRLNVVNGLLQATFAAGKFEASLSLADEAIARVEAAKSPREAFDDAEAELNWLYDSRARALQALGRWDDAVAALQKSKSLSEHGTPNVSNTINLADLYVMLGRADEALETLAPLVAGQRNASPYGRMQVQWVRYTAAMMKKDDATARKAFEFLRQHRADAPQTFQDALLWANRADEWARCLIERLHDPGDRGEALRHLQIYAEMAEPPMEAQLWKRVRELTDRADVRAAVAEVGTIERFDVPFSLGS